MLAAIFGVIVIAAFVVLGTGFVVALGMAIGGWWAFWLYPLWLPIMVGIFNLPAITFWQFWALVLFLRSKQASMSDFARTEPDDEKQIKNAYSLLASWILGPPLTYYVIAWLLS